MTRRTMNTFDLDVDEHRVVCDALRAHRRGLLDSEQLEAVDAYASGGPEAMRSAVEVLGAEGDHDAARLAGVAVRS